MAIRLAPIGVTQIDNLRPDTVPVHTLQYTAKTKLSDLAYDNVLFTPAVLALLNLPDIFNMYRQSGDQLTDAPKEFDVRLIEHPWTLFQGLFRHGVQVSWNNLLFCLPHHQWEEFSRWLGTVAFVNWHRLSKGEVITQPAFYRVRQQKISVRNADFDGNLLPETVPVIGICVFTDKGRFRFKELPLAPPSQSTSYFCAQWHANFDPSITINIKHFADALREGSPDPYGIRKLIASQKLPAPTLPIDYEETRGNDSYDPE